MTDEQKWEEEFEEIWEEYKFISDIRKESSKFWCLESRRRLKDER